MVAFAPPLTITAAEVDELLDIFEAALGEVLGSAVPGRTLASGVGGRASA
jgi:hypothetical protein